jgi:hypothetical protein
MRTRVERRQIFAFGRSRAWLLAGAMGSALLLGVPGAVAADLTVPLHPASLTSLSLIGVGSAGFAVSEGTGYGVPQTTGRLLTGPRGSELTQQSQAIDSDLSGVSGNTIYTVTAAPDPADGWVVHTQDLGTGVQASYPSKYQPVAWTPDGWLSVGGGTLRRHLASDGSTSTLLSGLATASQSNSYQEVTAKADGAGAVVSYPVKEAGDWKQAVGLITFGQAGIDRLAVIGGSAEPFSSISEIALSPTTVAWATSKVTDISENSSTYTEAISTRARSGGDITTIPSTTTSTAIEDLAVTGDQVAIATGFTDGFSDDSGTALTMRVWVSGLTKPAWRHITLPTPAEDPASVLYGGLASLGSEFFVGVGGDLDLAAGVYAIGKADATRVATVPAPDDPVQSVNLSAGRLTYSDLPNSVYGSYQAPVKTWRRSINGGLGAEVSEPISVIQPAGYFGVQSSFSAARGAGLLYRWGDRAAAGSGSFQLLDRDKVTHKIKINAAPTGPVRTSGPYSLLGLSTVYRADGKPMVDLAQRGVVGADLFGSTVVYTSVRGTVEVFDASWPESPKKPTVLARKGVCPKRGLCSTQVAIWGDTVAWVRTDGTIAVRSIGSTAVRVVHPQLTGLTGNGLVGAVTGLRLSEQTLSWQSTIGDFGSWVLDLSSPTSTPVELPSLGPISVDDHQVAGVTDIGRLVVQKLPFGQDQAYPPRLTGILTSAGFSPNGDGKADTWAPQIDATKPVDQVQLTISQGSTPVRVLTGTGPDGSIRDLSWDGLDPAGAPVANGVYTWTLTASAVDGGGSLIGSDGATSIGGTVEVKR